jgi:precorrin-6B methylase 2
MHETQTKGKFFSAGFGSGSLGVESCAEKRPNISAFHHSIWQVSAVTQNHHKHNTKLIIDMVHDANKLKNQKFRDLTKRLQVVPRLGFASAFFFFP